MRFKELELGGAFLIDLQPLEDERGFFARAWCRREAEAHGLIGSFVQCNFSFNRRKGTLRGMHYQVTPFREVKVVRCTRGAIHDVIIDLRPRSPSHLRWTGVRLDAADRKVLYVPEGFAHGFQTLEDETEVFYQVSQYYSPDFERGIRWDDPLFGIEWPEANPRIISPKDRNHPDFRPHEVDL